MRSLAVTAALLVLALPGYAKETKLEARSEAWLPQDKDGNFTLYVSNQSIAMPLVDITVRIDGKLAVRDEFHVKGKRILQHNWIKHVFVLKPGKHTLFATTKKGKAVLERKFEVKDKHWAVIDYSYNRRTAKKLLLFRIKDERIMFD